MTARKPKEPKATMITFEDDVLRELLERTEKGEPLSRICQDSRMPARATVYEWLEHDKDFAGRFHSARARGVHALVESTLEIADEPSKDAVAATDKRIRIDTRLRLAGKWLPSVYGERSVTELTGPNGGPIQTEAVGDLASLPKAKRDAIRAAIKAAVEK